MFRRSFLRRGIVETITKENFTLSRLTNGLRVITCDDGNGITGMGLFTLNAARFEGPDSFGASAVYEFMPLHGGEIITEKEVSAALGMFGNAYKVCNNKEALAVMLMMPRYHQKDGLDLLDAMCLHPSTKAEKFEVAKQQTRERTQLLTRDPTTMCFEMVHDAAWSGQGLGNPLTPTEPQLEALTVDKFHRFFRTYTRPDRAVVAATGVADHAEFALEAEKRLHFDYDATVTIDVPASPYTGGDRRVQNTEAPESMNKFQEKNLSHVGLFFQGTPVAHPDYYTLSVIQTLLGGGTSFSSGGPGKGMQTKLFREVLNREAGLHGMECITAWYSEGGLIGFYGSAPHEHAQRLVAIMMQQGASIAARVTDYHLEMAKNQLRSQLILLGEGREQLLNDMGFNMLVHNFMITPAETMEGSAKVTQESLKRVARELVERPLTFVVYGETKGSAVL
ncbi:mitochondrial processing peptidase [Strigomonas culicis]|uniref:Mitochondrial processing peptidase n=1 Tax=Strigomonas culicis TaxID=28005 RepID=S9U736_9TRYP|nr:mitochondrial processing peptidase [Strigomonas culicis]EPY28378.1 mitochondrial processing peptidase [Strigomonas culicis]|eukprot:EPY24713.1 mitochondrial processing peptidase [Strigomonas culicis]